MSLIKKQWMTCWNYAFQTSEYHGGLKRIAEFGYKEVTKEEAEQHSHYIILMYSTIINDRPSIYHYIRMDNKIFSAKEGKGGNFVESSKLEDLEEFYKHSCPNKLYFVK